MLTARDIDNQLAEIIEHDPIILDRVSPDQLGPECMVDFQPASWQSHVPEDIRNLWAELPLSARMVAYVMASENAYRDDPFDSIR